MTMQESADLRQVLPPPLVPESRLRRAGLGGMITVLIGCMLVVCAGWLTQRAKTFIKHSVPAEGTVTGYRTVYSRRYNKTYHAPIFVFTDGAGKSWHVESYSPEDFQLPLGSKIPIRYEPDHPADAEVDSFTAMWGYSLAVAVIGGVVILCGGGAIWFAQLKLAEAVRANVKPVVESPRSSSEANLRESWKQVLAAPGDPTVRRQYIDALNRAGDWRANMLKSVAIDARSKDKAKTLEAQSQRWRDESFGALLKKWDAQLDFTEGWPNELTLTASNFVRHASEIVATIPLRHLNLSAVSEAPEIFALPQFNQIATLKGSNQTWSDQAIAALAASDQLRDLRWLDLSNAGLHEEQIETLAVSPKLRVIDILHLNDNPCRDPADAANGYGTDGITGMIVSESVSLPAFGRELEQRHGNIRWLHPLDHYGPLPPSRYTY